MSSKPHFSALSFWLAALFPACADSSFASCCLEKFSDRTIDIIVRYNLTTAASTSNRVTETLRRTVGCCWRFHRKEKHADLITHGIPEASLMTWWNGPFWPHSTAKLRSAHSPAITLELWPPIAPGAAYRSSQLLFSSAQHLPLHYATLLAHARCSDVSTGAFRAGLDRSYDQPVKGMSCLTAFVPVLDAQDPFLLVRACNSWLHLDIINHKLYFQPSPSCSQTSPTQGGSQS